MTTKHNECEINKNNKLNEFIENFHNKAKLNIADLSSDQDLSIAIMNLISIEEHLFFTGAKTEKTKYYDMINDIREIRKEMLKKIITEYEGEIWCTSKHLLSASMRLMEVGTKQQSLGNNEEAYNMFEKSYHLYCLFWSLNIKDIGVDDKKSFLDSASNLIQKYKEEMPIDFIKTDSDPRNKIKSESLIHKKDHRMKKVFDFVKNSINCCRE